MFKLRDYQSDGIEQIRSLFRKNIKRIVFCAPTGSGKTAIFTFLAKEISGRNKRVLILTDRCELLEQAGGSFSRLNLSHDYYTAKTKIEPKNNVIIAMVETLKRRNITEFIQSFDVVIADEAHKAPFDKLFEFTTPDQYILGFTATPQRKGKQPQLSMYYDAIIQDISIKFLIDNGFLAAPKYFGVQNDVSKLKKIGGDYSEREQQSFFTKTEQYKGLERNYKLFKDKKTIIFCPTIETCEGVILELQKFSSQIVYFVHSGLSKQEREQQLSDFDKSINAIMVNCGVLTTGYDCPSIDVVVLYRATTSLPLFLQMVGRGSRTTETKKEFTILDFGMNVKTHGFWHNERVWELDHSVRKKGEGVAPVKFCQKCEAILPASAKKCSYCGEIFKAKEKQTAELSEITENSPIDWDKRNCKSLKDFQDYAKRKGYKSGWAWHQFQLRHKSK